MGRTLQRAAFLGYTTRFTTSAFQSSLVLMASALFLFPMSASGESYWEVRSNSAGGHQAITGFNLDKRLQGYVGIFIVDFDPRKGCHPGVGTAFLKGPFYGSYTKKGKAKRRYMTVEVDGRRRWKEHPMLVFYTNGVEGIFRADDALIRALSNGSFVRSRISEDVPTIEFSLEGAGNAIESAEHKCRSRL